jgi:hypothetical protein
VYTYNGVHINGVYTLTFTEFRNLTIYNEMFINVTEYNTHLLHSMIHTYFIQSTNLIMHTYFIQFTNLIMHTYFIQFTNLIMHAMKRMCV